MSDELADLLDFEVAWARSRAEIARTAGPYELPLIEYDLASWLSELEYQVRTDAYSPVPIEITELPKAQGIVRPLAVMTPADRVVYAALVSASLPADLLPTPVLTPAW
jgi:hypothetical protein